MSCNNTDIDCSIEKELAEIYCLLENIKIQINNINNTFEEKFNGKWREIIYKDDA